MKRLVLSLLTITQFSISDEQSNIEYEIATASTTGTYYKIGNDLKKYVARSAHIDLYVKSSKGSLDNVYKLYSPKYPKLKFAIVQNDVMELLKEESKNGNIKAKRLIKKLRVIMPLYNEEIHIITRKESAINSFSDLKGKKLSIGRKKSGTASTSSIIYQKMFGKEISNYKLEDFNSALDSLDKREVEAIIYVGGQPIPALSKFPETAKESIKFVAYNEKSPTENLLMNSYYPVDIKASYYKWLDNNVPTLSTKAYLITYDYKSYSTKAHIKEFIQQLKEKIPSMKKMASTDPTTPHPKWKEIQNICESYNSNPKLPNGWKYYSAVKDVCSNTSKQINNISYGNKRTTTCTKLKRDLGLCN